MFIKKISKKNKISFSFLVKVYFFTTLIILFLTIFFIFNTGLWINQKQSILNRVYFNGINNYTKVLTIFRHATKIFFYDYDKIELNIPYDNLLLIEPVGWLELMGLVKHSNFVLTDSGGLQKEALWHRKHCFTLRNETEWTETINQKVNTLVKEDDQINLSEIKKCDYENPYANKNSSKKIIEIIKNN